MAKRTVTYRITRQGAQHWGPPEGKNGERKRYGYGDTIELPSSAGTDPAYNNLGLQLKGEDREVDVAAEEKELEQVPANPTVRPAPGDIGKADEDGGTNEGDKGDVEPEKTNQDAEVEALIAELEDSNGNAELQAVRQKVIEADLFEEGTVPTKKADLMQALIDLKEAE